MSHMEDMFGLKVKIAIVAGGTESFPLPSLCLEHYLAQQNANPGDKIKEVK